MGKKTVNPAAIKFAAQGLSKDGTRWVINHMKIEELYAGMNIAVGTNGRILMLAQIDHDVDAAVSVECMLPPEAIKLLTDSKFSGTPFIEVEDDDKVKAGHFTGEGGPNVVHKSPEESGAYPNWIQVVPHMDQQVNLALSLRTLKAMVKAMTTIKADSVVLELPVDKHKDTPQTIFTPIRFSVKRGTCLAFGVLMPSTEEDDREPKADQLRNSIVDRAKRAAEVRSTESKVRKP